MSNLRIGKCGTAPCVPRVLNSVCNYYFCARLCDSESPAADLLIQLHKTVWNND